MKVVVTLGRSVEQRAIRAFIRRGRADRTVLVLGGMHGDEPKSVELARRLVRLLGGPMPPLGPPLLRGDAAWTRWVIVPAVNPDGYARRTRRNARRVDINRNFPTSNWTLGPRRSRMYGGPAPASESETRAVMRAVECYRPQRIITIHSIGLDRFCNNYDGPGRTLAMAMKRRNRYPVTGSIGYPTPGSFGSWAGRELGIAVVTLELPSLQSAKRCWADNREAILAGGQW